MSIFCAMLAVEYFRCGYKASGYLTIAASVVAAIGDILITVRLLFGV